MEWATITEGWKTIESEPEDFGLTLLHRLDTGGSYQFCTSLLLRDAGGALYLAQDSGCSCPTPFEDFVDPGMLLDVEGEAWLMRRLHEHHDVGGLSPADVLEFVHAWKKAEGA